MGVAAGRARIEPGRMMNGPVGGSQSGAGADGQAGEQTWRQGHRLGRTLVPDRVNKQQRAEIHSGRGRDWDW